MKTFGRVLGSQQGFGAGFDFVRIFLAMSILAFHSVVVTGWLGAFNQTPLWIVPNIMVPMFFAVSGFLITGSALRLKLRDFLINRGLRIFPALGVDIMISALILGPIFTIMPLKEYFSDPQFWRYFGSIVGLIQYQLPGVFLSNESAGVVNQSLWTVPYEFFCYIVMSLIIVTKLLHRPKVLLCLGAIYLLIPIALQIVLNDVSHLPKLVSSLFFGRGSGSFECFIAGILVYLYRDKVPYSLPLAAISVAAVAIVALSGNEGWSQNGFLNFALTPCITYFILYIGLSPIPKLPIYNRGDYSYGVYLYGYPVQQAIYSLVPNNTNWLANFILSAVFVTLIAMLSWHNIEKPILKLRKNFSFVGRRIADGEAPPRNSTTTNRG